MPREPRLDIEGRLYHVIARGIEKGRIFVWTSDYKDFLDRLGRILLAHGAKCYAWALLPNHLHLLIRRGSRPLSRTMQKALTGYAVAFNLRHERSGHLFQNRYKALICEEDSYFLELVRYIHLNPLRARLIASYPELARYPWSGHAAIMGGQPMEWHDSAYVLSCFGDNHANSKDAYSEYLLSGINGRERGEFEGKGLIRVPDDSAEPATGGPMKRAVRGDIRILGSIGFSREILAESKSRERRERPFARALAPEDVLRRAAEAAGIPFEAMHGRDHHARRVLAKNLACKWLVVDLGMKVNAVAKVLGISASSVSRGVELGRASEESKCLRLR